MKKETINYGEKFIKKGVIKLQDDLTTEFGLWTGSEYYELKDVLKSYVGDNKVAKITIKDDKTGNTIFNEIVDIPTLRIERFLEDILWDITNTKVLFSVMEVVTHEE